MANNEKIKAAIAVPSISVRSRLWNSSKTLPISFSQFCFAARYILNYQDVAEFFLLRGFRFTYETAQDKEVQFLPHFTDQIQNKWKDKVRKV